MRRCHSAENGDVYYFYYLSGQLCACYNSLTQQAGNSNQNTISRTQAHTAHRHTGTHPLSLSMKLIGHDEGHQHIVVTYKRVSRAICPSIRHSHLAINNHLHDSLPKLIKVLLGLECALSELVTNQSVSHMQNLITSC